MHLARAARVTCASGVVVTPTLGRADVLCIAQCLLIPDDFARMGRKQTRTHERSPTVAISACDVFNNAKHLA